MEKLEHKQTLDLQLLPLVLALVDKFYGFVVGKLIVTLFA